MFALTSLTVVIGAGVALFVAWVRGWRWVSNLMWRGYDPEGERPPLWKMRISGVALGLSRREFSKLPAAYREAEDLADDDTTAHEAMINYLEAVFVEDGNSDGDGGSPRSAE